MLRKKGVVGKFVEFYGDGRGRAEPGRSRHHRQHGAGVRRDHRRLPDRRCDARLSAHDQSPARCRSRWWRPTRRSRDCSASTGAPDPVFSDTLELDLATVVPSLAGPKRPQDRINLPDVKQNFLTGLGATPKTAEIGDQRLARDHSRRQRGDRRDHQLHQHVESFGDGRRGPAGEESRGARPEVEAVGEDQPRAGIESGDGLSERRRFDAVSRKAAIQPGRLRLHHLHRQQRAAAGRSRRGRDRRKS